MKVLMLTALVLISFGATASAPVGDFPKIQFGSIFVPVDEVCVNQERIETQNLVPVCVKWGGGEASHCIKEVKRILSTPIRYSKEIPHGEGSFETIEQVIPLTYKIKYGYYSEGGMTSVYSKTYTIPVCE